MSKKKDQTTNSIGHEIKYFEFESSYNRNIKLSLCKLKIGSKDPGGLSRVLLFVPEIGVSYKNYFEYMKTLLSEHVVDEIVTFDHYGSGVSGGMRGFNIDGENYVSDMQKAYQVAMKELKAEARLIVFGHGFGATLSLISESEGFLGNVSGLIIKDPFLGNDRFRNITKKISQAISSKKIKSYINIKSYSGKRFFPTVRDQSEFDRLCINTQYQNLDFLETFSQLSKSVIERSYLTEKPILFFHSGSLGMKSSGELLKLYQKGVGENIVTSIELDKSGYFENFSFPSLGDIEKVRNWVESFN